MATVKMSVQRGAGSLETVEKDCSGEGGIACHVGWHSRKVSVPCGDLGAWLRGHGGAELAALSSFDFDRVPVEVIVVECHVTTPAAGCMTIRRALAARGFRFVQRVGGDDVWLHSTAAAAPDPGRDPLRDGFAGCMRDAP
eukprot:gene29055-55078_t